MTEPAEARSSRVDLVTLIILGGFGVFTLVLGVWAMVAPHSFFDNIGHFEPYNRHFVHDVGAFQIGLGAAAIFALIWRGDALLAVARRRGSRRDGARDRAHRRPRHRRQRQRSVHAGADRGVVVRGVRLAVVGALRGWLRSI